MKRRKWGSKTKFRIVLEGFKGRAISEICNEYQISQAQYYKWRDHFLTFGQKAFEVAQATSTEQRLNQINLKLKTLVGELTMEVKKNRHALGQPLRGPYLRVVLRNQDIVAKLHQFKKEHPFWGYRRGFSLSKIPL